MRALVLEAEHELPSVKDVPRPKAGPGQVVVKVAASGLNYADTMMRRGFYLQKPQFPYTPGFEFSGIVEEIAPDVKTVRPGDRVMGTGQGTFAEYATAAPLMLMPVPEGFSDEEAAAFPVVYLTALGMLRLSAKAVAGETILIHAAAGGVGTAAIQLSKHLGLRVIATASSEQKLVLARSLGADVTINYGSGNWVDAVMTATHGRGVDIVFESIGGDFLDRDVQAAAPFGRIVVFGMASGDLPKADVGAMFHHSVSVGAFWMFTLAMNPDLLSAVSRELLEIVRKANIRPVIGKVCSLEEAPGAIQAMEQRRTTGKIILKP
ncbi:MAG: NADPH:quinone oxidoreductase family protein [Bryobacteraceae bacterium]